MVVGVKSTQREESEFQMTRSVLPGPGSPRFVPKIIIIIMAEIPIRMKGASQLNK